MSLTSIVYMTIFIVLIVNIAALLFNFFGINFSSYSNYLLWIIALIIFFMLLPKNKGNIFISDNQ
jgi:hypothetical protein